MADIPTLRKERAPHRRLVTLTAKKAKDIISTGDINSEQVTQLRAYLSMLKNRLPKLEEYDSRIATQITDDEELDKEVEEANNYQIYTYVSIEEIEEALRPKVDVVPKSEIPVPTTDETITERSRAQVKLPKVNIDPFDGEATNYPAFIDSFKRIIHENSSLADIEKFYYLRGLLKGKAKNTVEGLNLSEENYKEAIDLLEKRYGDKKLLQASFVDTLLKLKGVSDARDTKALRNLHDNIEKCIRNLKSLEITTDSFGPMLIPCIIQKLPEEIRLEITKDFQKDSWDFDEVLQLFNTQLTAREKCYFMRNSEKSATKSVNSELNTAFSLTSQKSKPNPTCVFCNSPNHKAWNCDVITDVKRRKKMLLDQRRCFNCLSKNHQANKCTSRFSCYNCKQKHNSAICENDDTPKDGNTDPTAHQFTTTVDNTGEETVLLKTAIVSISDVEGEYSCKDRLLLDDASTKSYITKRLRDQLNLRPISNRRIMIKGACASTTVSDCEVVQLRIQTLEPNVYICITASVLDEICHPLDGQTIKLATKKYPHISNLKFSDVSHDETSKAVGILVGADYYYEFLTGVTKKHPSERGPVAVLTKVGWVLGGPLPSCEIALAHTNMCTDYSFKCSTSFISVDDPLAETEYSFKCSTSRIFVDDPLTEQVKNFWSMESIGIVEDTEDTTEYSKFANDLVFNESTKRYEVRLTWKDNLHKLPDNFSNSKRRLTTKIKSMQKKPEVLHEYHNTITSQLSDDVIEGCSQTDDVTPIHYLPHRAVIKDDRSSTKLRIVYDASSSVSKNLPSLNDCLLKGPSLNPLIVDVLLRFRVHICAFICDIQKAFLQISIKEIDRDVLRFLWVEDPFADELVYVVYRFTRVLFGLVCSPFLLNGTLREHFRRYLLKYPEFSKLIEALIRSLYVDDFAGGGRNKGEVHSKFTKLVEILALASFTVHKFISNDMELNRLLKTSVDNDPSRVVNESKVLGMLWNYANDVFRINLAEIVSYKKQPTKRDVLKTLAKIYDPLGFVSPVVLCAKILFQEACKLSKDWDAVLPESILKRWNAWETDLVSSHPFQIQRCYIPDINFTRHSLIGFCDGSSKAYAATIYLRSQTKDGDVNTILIGSKARVAPLEKNFTVPRLELLGCLILSRFMQTVVAALENELEILTKRYYTDSTISLYRIKGVDKEFKQFVQNRVTEIRDKSDVDDWYYVPTKLNPSDLPSRGCLLSELNSNKMWVNGPEFIMNTDVEVFEFRHDVPDSEIKGQSMLSTDMITLEKQVGPIPPDYFRRQNTNPMLSKLIDLNGYSDLHKLLRVTAYVVRFAIRSEIQADGIEVTPDEMEQAKNLWIRSEQRRYAYDNKQTFVKTSSNLNFFLEDDVIRCRGRLKFADLTYNTKYPVFLPPSSPLTKLVILDCHDAVFHQRVTATLTQLRNDYWVPTGRRMVRNVIRPCNLCKLFDGLPYGPTTPPDLPDFRVHLAPPFTNVGTDHTGPLYVKDIYNRSGNLHKCYIAIFSCCSTRMLHLELQPNLEAPATIRGMQRTFSRVGTPNLILSDNHKTYKSKSVKTFAGRYFIKWKHILERTPHWGGFYERMNSIIKKALKKSLKNAKLTYEELETIIIKIEMVINSRPLTYLQDDEVLEPVTPSHLMYGRRIMNKPNPVSRNQEVNPTKRIRYLNKLLEKFKQRYSTEYLTGLREREKRSGRYPDIAEGDVVIVKEKYLPRSLWKLGRITRVIRASDGVPKGAQLKTELGTLNRPLHMLYPMEIREKGSDPDPAADVTDPDRADDVTDPDPAADGTDSAATVDVIDSVNDNNKSRGKRNRRIAAINGELIRRLNIPS